MGYDDALLVSTAPGRSLYEADPSAEELALLRSLVPRDNRLAYTPREQAVPAASR
jgi:hypothetical protein